MRRALAVVLTLLAIVLPREVDSGPPFVTDDPEPVAPQHWELYTGYALEVDREGRTGALPFLEVNWGPRRNVQLAVFAPYAFSLQQGARNRGLGDLEFGVKLRFIPEDRLRPQLAFYPIAAEGTGDVARHLGEGGKAIFLPLWAQKQVGAVTVYGGAGIWNRSGVSPARWSQTGIVVEVALHTKTMVGAETYRVGARGADEPAYTAIAGGAAYDLDEHHRIMFSLGRASRGAPHSTAYVALETLLGPR